MLIARFCVYRQTVVILVGSVADHLRLKELRFHGRLHADALGQFGRRSDAHGHRLDRALSYSKDRAQTCAQETGVRLLITNDRLNRVNINICINHFFKMDIIDKTIKIYLKTDGVVLEEKVIEGAVTVR